MSMKLTESLPDVTLPLGLTENDKSCRHRSVKLCSSQSNEITLTFTAFGHVRRLALRPICVTAVSRRGPREEAKTKNPSVRAYACKPGPTNGPNCEKYFVFWSDLWLPELTEMIILLLSPYCNLWRDWGGFSANAWWFEHVISSERGWLKRLHHSNRSNARTTRSLFSPVQNKFENCKMNIFINKAIT